MARSRSRPQARGPGLPGRAVPRFQRVEVHAPVEGPGQVSALEDLADLLGDADRRRVPRGDDRDEPCQAEVAERPVSAGDRALGRVALVPVLAPERPADLRLELAVQT